MSTRRVIRICAGSGSDGNLYIVDAVRYKGSVWVVGGWLEYPHLGHKVPSYIVRLPKEAKLSPAGASYPFEWLLTGFVIPPSFDSPATAKAQGFEVREEPALEFPITRGVH